MSVCPHHRQRGIPYLQPASPLPLASCQPASLDSLLITLPCALILSPLLPASLLFSASLPPSLSCATSHIPTLLTARASSARHAGASTGSISIRRRSPPTIYATTSSSFKRAGGAELPAHRLRLASSAAAGTPAAPHVFVYLVEHHFARLGLIPPPAIASTVAQAVWASGDFRPGSSGVRATNTGLRGAMALCAGEFRERGVALRR